MKLDLLVRRKGIDPVAETALYALRELMHRDIPEVASGELWRFECEAATESDREQLLRAACRAGRYINTNRDVARWVDWQAFPDPGAAGCSVDLWVRPKAPAEPSALRYFRTHGCAWLQQVEWGRWYRLQTRLRDAGAARELAMDLAVTRSRQHGLLLNPHLQDYTLLAVQEAR